MNHSRGDAFRGSVNHITSDITLASSQQFKTMSSNISGSYVYFGSGMKVHQLSNFNQCEIEGEIWIKDDEGRYLLKTYTFPSSEHYWWSHFFVKDEDIRRIAIGGDLSTLEGLKHFYKGEVLEKKIKYWGKKDNVGIVPKILAGKKGTNYRKRAMELGMCMSIHPCPKYGIQGLDITLNRIWSKILIAKYTQNRGHREILLSTFSKHLIEFTRAPEKRLRSDFWAGRVIDGKLCGRNYMGDCMMSVRDVLS